MISVNNGQDYNLWPIQVGCGSLMAFFTNFLAHFLANLYAIGLLLVPKEDHVMLKLDNHLICSKTDMSSKRSIYCGYRMLIAY